MSSSSESSSSSFGQSAIWSSMADETFVAVGAAVAAARCSSSQLAGAGAADRRFVRKDCAGAISFGAASGCIAAGGATLLVGQSGNASNQQTSGLCHLRRGANRANQKENTQNLLPTLTSYLGQILLVHVLVIFGMIGYLSLSIRTAEVRTRPSVL